ncbi:MAG: 3-isopropylmalate dehydratase small subunit [Sphingomonadaceae bacterium]
MPEPLVRLTATALPLMRDNVDTDIIIPSREIRGTGKTGLKDGLFAAWRYLAPGSREEDPDFPLNRPEYRNARIWLAGANVGCGSSREHAAWALAEYGFRAVIAPSFNPIFFGNCVRNGIAPVVLPRETIAGLASPVTVDLEAMTVNGHRVSLPEEARLMLMEGLDPIALTLKHAAEIARWQQDDRTARPWAWLALAETSPGPQASPGPQ